MFFYGYVSFCYGVDGFCLDLFEVVCSKIVLVFIRI